MPRPPSSTPPPPIAAAVFGDRLALATRYADWLTGPAAERGLIGPAEVDRIWERHLLNCAVVTDLVPAGASVLDIGSGAGLPGLAVALRRPDLQVTLVEPMARRCAFLEEVVADLGLVGVEIRRARAEELAAEVAADVVLARAVAPLSRLVTICVPLTTLRGQMLALKGATAANEVAAAAAALATANAAADIVAVSLPNGAPGATVVRVVRPRPPRAHQKQRPSPGGRGTRRERR